MAITDTDVELEFSGVAQGVPVVVSIQTSGVASEISVRYSTAKIDAVQGVDYTLTFPVDLSTFSMTPTLSLMGKIGATGLGNVIYVKRTLPYVSDFDYDNAFVREKLVDEFDRTWMAFQQIDYSLGDMVDANDAAAAAAASAAEAAESAAEAAAANAAMNYVENYGAVGDGVTDDSIAIQAAINSGQPVRFMAKTYVGALTNHLVIGGLDAGCIAVLRSGTVLLGAGMGKTIIKLKDNQTTDAAPRPFNILAGTGLIDGLIIRDMTFDLNGQNNKISPNRDDGTPWPWTSGHPYNPWQCAAIAIGGTIAVGGQDGIANNARIRNVAVVNGPGMSSIVLGLGAATRGVRNVIENCYFYNNGLDAGDHSSIYLWTRDSVVRNCYFDHPTPSVGARGPIVAVELSGTGNSMLFCTVNNYLQMCWVDASTDGGHFDNRIIGNRSWTNAVGIGFYTFTTNFNGGIVGTIIEGNNIFLTNNPITHPGINAYASAIQLVCDYGPVQRILINGNIFTCQDTANNYGIIMQGTANGSIEDVTIGDNIFNGWSVGIAINPINVINTTIVNNIMKVFTPTTLRPTQTVGIWVCGNTAGNLYQVNIMDNYIGSRYAEGTSAPYWAIALGTAGASTLTGLHIENNRLEGTNAAIQDLITVTRRTGRQARTFANLPTQSTWSIGDEAYYSNPTVLGSAGSKYVLKGWSRLTAGSGNVLNTDWAENRALTGT